MLNLVVSIFVILVHVLIFYIIKHKTKLSKQVLYVIAIFLLTYKSIETIYNIINKGFNRIPVEFSTVSYFVLSITVIFNLKHMRPFATVASLIAGFGYLLVVIPTAHVMVDINGLFLFIMALINHSLLYIASFILMSHYLFTKEQTFKPIIYYTLAIVLHAVIMYFIIDFSELIRFIYIILGAHSLYQRVDNIIALIILYGAYYFIVANVYLLGIKLFYKVNKRVYALGLKYESNIDILKNNENV